MLFLPVEIHTGPSHSRAALETDWLEVRDRAEFVFIESKGLLSLTCIQIKKNVH